MTEPELTKYGGPGTGNRGEAIDRFEGAGAMPTMPGVAARQIFGECSASRREIGVRQARSYHDPTAAPLGREHHDAAASHEHGPGAARPRQRISVGFGSERRARQRIRVRRITRRKCDHRRVGVVARGTEPLHRVGQRKLGAPQSIHEITASYLTTVFHPLELAIDRAPANRRSLTPPPVTRDDAVPNEPLLRDRGRVRILR